MTLRSEPSKWISAWICLPESDWRVLRNTGELLPGLNDARLLPEAYEWMQEQLAIRLARTVAPAFWEATVGRVPARAPAEHAQGEDWACMLKLKLDPFDVVIASGIGWIAVCNEQNVPLSKAEDLEFERKYEGVTWRSESSLYQAYRVEMEETWLRIFDVQAMEASGLYSPGRVAFTDTLRIEAVIRATMYRTLPYEERCVPPGPHHLHPTQPNRRLKHL